MYGRARPRSMARPEADLGMCHGLKRSSDRVGVTEKVASKPGVIRDTDGTLGSCR